MDTTPNGYEDFMDDATDFGSGDEGSKVKLTVESDWFYKEMELSPQQAYAMFTALAEDARENKE